MIKTDSQIFFSILTVKCIISVQRSPVNKMNMVTNDQEVLFHPYLDGLPFSSTSLPLHSCLNKSADINRYKIINIPRLIIGFMESANVKTIFLNFSQSFMSLKILKSLKALMISKFEFSLPLKDMPISRKLMRTTKQSKQLNLSSKYLINP